MLLAKLVQIIHILFISVVIFGCLFPPRFLIYHLILWPGLLLHWKLNNNKCFLTEIEKKLRGTKTTLLQDNWSFSKNILNSMGLSIVIKTKNTENFFHIIYILSWLISLFRLYYQIF